MLLIILQHILLLHLKSIHVARSSSTYQLYTPRPRHEIFRHSFKFSGLLYGIPSLLTSKTQKNANSSTVYIWGGSAILPHNCIIQCYTDYRKYSVYQTCEFNVMTVLVYPIWVCTCVPGIYCSITLSCSIELYMSYFIDPWFGIETQILMYSACLSLRSTNL